MNILKFILDRPTIILLLLLGITGCQASNPKSDPAAETSRLDTQLVLNNVVLEQSNQQDNTTWKIKADRVVYSEDKQVAALTKVVGNLIQNNITILKVSAESGKVTDNGNIILLEDSVVASDPRNGSVITSEEVEWQPQKNLLLIKQELRGIQDNLTVSAQTGRYLTDRERFEIQGDVVATSSQPALQLNSDRLEWDMPQKQIVSPGAIELVQYDQNQIITDRLVSDRAELNLAEDRATLNQNIELVSSEPALQIATNFLAWNYQDRIGITDRPIQILVRDRQISLTGNAGEINFPLQIAKLQNGVKGINQAKASELYARDLIWKMDIEEVEALGNVIYEQTDPKARLTGEKARGTLGDNKIVVTSDGKQQVTSIIE